MTGPADRRGAASRPDPLAFLADEVAALRERHLYRALRVMSSAQGPIVSVDDRRLISLSSNDYLGLTHHPRVCDAAANAVREFGSGSGAVRTIAGTMSIHEALEAELAVFKETPAVLTFQSGFTANTGVIPVVTDGVFSMDGDIAPLPGIVAAAEEFGAAVMVDDAHASGVLGRDGRGSVDHFGLHGRVAIQVGTLSKAVGSLGGYVAGSMALREILTQRARPFLFSTSHPPSVVASCREAIKVMQDEPELLERLWANTRSFKTELTRLGFDTGVSETPITPVMMGDPDTAGRFSDRLIEEGVFAQPVVFPTVAIDKSRLRTIVTAAHADEQLDIALAAFDRVGHELGLISG